MQNRQILSLILLAVMVGFGIYIIKPFFAPLAWAAILAFVTRPVNQKLISLCGTKHTVAATISTILLIFLLVVPVLFMLTHLQKELADLYRELSNKFVDKQLALPSVIANIPIIGPSINDTLIDFWNDPEFRKQKLNDWLEPWVREFAGIVGKIGRSLAQFALATIALFFFYRDGDQTLEQMRKGLRKIVGDPADRYFDAVGVTTRAVVSGLLVSAFTQGLIAGAGYAFIGVSAPVLLGALTALAALVPFIGTLMVWGPISLWLLLSDQIVSGIVLLAYGTLIINPTDNIIKPLLISNATDIPLVIVLFGVMGGLIAFGFVGLFLGPLILSVLLAIWREWLDESDSPI
ncbi:AI-2E family transporter [Methylocystaceae bacterium]|nr:AI-2E family transporter [Methylocystaceae bacterium]